MLKLVDRLTDISEKFTDLQFLVDTGGISRKAGIAELNKLTKEFDVLSAQADRLAASTQGGRTDAATSGTIVNLTVNGAIDSESTARQIVEILNDSQARGTLGAAGFSR
jgi:hypothetical protein